MTPRIRKPGVQARDHRASCTGRRPITTTAAHATLRVTNVQRLFGDKK